MGMQCNFRITLRDNNRIHIERHCQKDSRLQIQPSYKFPWNSYTTSFMKPRMKLFRRRKMPVKRKHFNPQYFARLKLIPSPNLNRNLNPVLTLKQHMKTHIFNQRQDFPNLPQTFANVNKRVLNPI